jgi:hypothetical protein
MGTHPNAVLVLALKPTGDAVETYDAITGDDDKIDIGGESYRAQLMEDSYDEDYQIAANDGEIIVFNLVTYGYGDTIDWDKLEAQKKALEQWAADICARHGCSHRIFVTANYW